MNKDKPGFIRWSGRHRSIIRILSRIQIPHDVPALTDHLSICNELYDEWTNGKAKPKPHGSGHHMRIVNCDNWLGWFRCWGTALGCKEPAEGRRANNVPRCGCWWRSRLCSSSVITQRISALCTQWRRSTYDSGEHRISCPFISIKMISYSWNIAATPPA